MPATFTPVAEGDIHEQDTMESKESAYTQKRPIILVGGGTGGHIFPLVAIGEELASKKVPFIYVGSRDSKEEAVAKSLNWQFRPIEAGKWRRYFSLQSLILNLRDTVRVAVGFFQSIKLLHQTEATTVVSKGGFVALPMVYAARFTGRRLIIHESDAVMGATNRLSSRFANKVLTAFPPEVYPNQDSKFVQVGIPIRRNLRQAATLKSPTKPRPLLFIIAGSQGSSAINSYIAPIIRELAKYCDIVHSVGEKNETVMKQIAAKLPKADQGHYKPVGFIERELPYYYQSADLVLSRASATTIAEGATFSKAMYLIPLPNASANHQVVNARKLEQAGAAIVREQYQLSPEKLLADISELMNNKEKRSELGEKLHGYFNCDESVQKVVEIIG